MQSNPEIATVETAGKTALHKLLMAGIDQGHVWPAFQPIVDIRSGNVAGFEILARWGEPSTAEISPMTFIPRLEQYGLIDILSDALISRACREATGWPGQFSLAFNISPLQLTNEDFPHRLSEIIATTGFPMNRVELEVTEGSLLSDDDQAYRTLHKLNALGVKIGIDDFGTGYSSLARLESFPFHKLKIDKRFVSTLDVEPSKRRIAAAVIGLGQSLGMTVVAEGVETADEESILRNLGCDLAQGWLYSKGLPAHQALCKLNRRGVVDASGRSLDTSPFQQFHQLASLYEQAPVGLCFLDMDFRHVRVNDRFGSILGLTGAEIEGKTIYDLLEGEVLESVITVLMEAAATGEPVIREYVVGTRDIQVINTRVLDLGGKEIGYSIVSIDVTEENRLKANLI
ncbi:MAG: EAL domain-containing protein [Agrobacterium tumefaciens]|nr:EAL domain-containing protein [Agrobacterium tumefaciens]